jgi:DnaJ-class molecular chaperone
METKVKTIELRPGDIIPTELLCGECTGDGRIAGVFPCKVCGGKGYIADQIDEIQDINN